MSGELYEYLRKCGSCRSNFGEKCNCGRQEALKEYTELKNKEEKMEEKLGKAHDIINEFGFLIFSINSNHYRSSISFNVPYEKAVKWLKEYEDRT